MTKLQCSCLMEAGYLTITLLNICLRDEGLTPNRDVTLQSLMNTLRI